MHIPPFMQLRHGMRPLIYRCPPTPTAEFLLHHQHSSLTAAAMVQFSEVGNKTVDIIYGKCILLLSFRRACLTYLLLFLGKLV